MKGIRNLAVRVATCALVSLAVLAGPGAPAAYATLNDASLVCAKGPRAPTSAFRSTPMAGSPCTLTESTAVLAVDQLVLQLELQLLALRRVGRGLGVVAGR